MYWRQRAKAHWLVNGDRNTKFFHLYASKRKRRSRISKLVKEDGAAVEQEEIKLLIANFYKDLFTSHAGSHMEDLLQHVLPRVSDEMNEMLMRPFTEEEIKQGLNSISDLKAPGPNGMPFLFYKKFWDIMGTDVTREVLHFLNGGALPEKWNEMDAVLVPKVQNPEKLKDLRPISLCNVVYKIASKVLSNHLKVILPDIVSQNQSAFVLGRMITNNVLIAYELTHYLQNKRTSTDGFAALKLDMSMAYDRIEWAFVEQIMDRLGFSSGWIQLIMKCITTVSYRVKINGELSDEIIPTRGLRQGNPLLPYLFLLCA